MGGEGETEGEARGRGQRIEDESRAMEGRERRGIEIGRGG